MDYEQLVGLGQELGLNVGPSSWNLSSQEKGRRKRLCVGYLHH